MTNDSARMVAVGPADCRSAPTASDASGTEPSVTWWSAPLTRRAERGDELTGPEELEIAIAPEGRWVAQPPMKLISIFLRPTVSADRSSE